MGQPIGNNPVTDLPGIGPVFGKRLSAQNFGNASNVLGQYLTNPDNFMTWLKDTCGANSKQRFDCYTALYTWSNLYVY